MLSNPDDDIDDGDPKRGRMEELEMRVEELEKALRDCIELAKEGISYTSPYFVEKWSMNEELAKVEAVLAHGP